MKEILLYSGGMDSYIAWQYLGKPKTLFVDLGHKYNAKEREAVKNTIPDTKIVEDLQIGKYEKVDSEIPLRNLLLAMYGAWEGADIIWLIVQKDEMSIPDRTESFFKNTSKLLSELMGKKILVDTPFRNLDKTDMVSLYKHGRYNVAELKKTVGCYSTAIGHCGDCPACLRRYIAFKNNDIEVGYELSDRIKKQYLDKLSNYSLGRQVRMRKWLK